MTATDPLALEGRGARPLTAVTPIDMEPSQFHIAEAEIGVIVAGRQLDPELREPLTHLARVAGFPILAEPTSQLRRGPHDRSYVITAYDLLLRDERFRKTTALGVVLRFGEMPTSKPLRAWLAESGAAQIRWATGTSRPAGRRRCCAPTRPSSPPAGLRGSARSGRHRRCGCRPSGRRARRSKRS